MPGQQATIDISARITGYQSSLNQLKQAIDQLDPGSSIRKSLQVAFKNAEGYINKLAKTPVVNVGSDKQLQNLVNTLQQATRLVTNVSDRLGEVTFKDINADILKDALEGVNQQLTETQQKLDSVTGGPQLSSLTGKVKNLQDAFKLIGQSIDGKNAQQGIELLNQGLEESKRKAEQARTALEAVRKKLAEWKAPEDPTGLFGAKSGGKGTKDINLLENLKVLDINASTFSPEAINNFKENLRQKLIDGLKDLTDEKTLNTLTDSIQAGLDNIFTNGLQSKDLKVKVQAFSQGVRDILKQTLGGNFGAAGIYEMMFGSGTTTSDRASGLAKQMLTQMTVEFTQGSEAIKQIIEDVANGGLSTKQPLLKLVQEGQLETVKNKLLQILRAAKEAREEITRTKGGLIAERDTAAANLKTQTQNSAQIEAAKNGILKTEEYQKAIVQISTLRNEIQQLKATISSMQNQKVEGIHRAGENAKAAGESYRLTNAEVEQYSNQLDQIKEKEKLVGKIQGVVERWFSIYAAIRMVSNAIRSIISTVQELDKTITNIAIVTDMSQADLWGQMPQYTKMARQFAASISGVYEVSQLYYQQGLQTADVMKLTESTLKMARISGLDYAESTDYMTNALRSFKMQMQDAEKIVNVYSAVAASSATNVEELAEAMSKTASSAEAVGSSFENTTAMMAVMIEATRQAPENIGSAMKSIISRYGELKVNPTTLVDSEGEALSLNKVDTALQSVGIAIHNANGEFREFDDVIFELAQKWNTIDVNTQRYIATVMAGNRQQSRFLALVSSYERLKEEAEVAANSQNAAQLQYLKTLDSIEAKQQQLKTSLQSLYTSTGVQAFYGTLIDLGNSVIKTFTDMPTIFNLPIPALLKLGTTFYNIASVVTQAFAMMKTRMNLQMQASESQITAIQAQQALKRGEITQDEYDRRVQAAQDAAEKVKIAERGITGVTSQESAKRNKLGNLFKSKTGGMIASAAGAAMTLGAAAIGTETNAERYGKAGLTGLGGALQGIGTGLMMGGPAGAVMGTLTALPSVIEAIGIAIETTEQKIEKYDKAIQDAANNKLISESEIKTLTDYRKKFEELKKHQNDSNQAKQEFIALNAQIAAKYPELISKIDSEGNLIVQLGNAYEQLKQKKKDAYDNSFIDYWEKQFKALYDQDFLASKVGANLNTLANTQLGNTAEKIKNKTKAQQVADQNIIEAQRSQLDIIKSLATESKDITNEYSISKEGYTELRKKLLQYINFSEEQFDITVGMIQEQNGQITFDGIELAKKFDAAMDSFLTTHSQATLQDWVKKWNLSDSVNTEQITSAVQEINSYEETLQKNLITSMVADVRKIYDAIFDPESTLNNLSGSFINDELINSAKAAIENAEDPSAAFKAWASSTLPKLYTQLLKKIQNNNILFSTLNKYYENLEQLSNSQYLKLQSQYQNTEVWGTFKKEYQQLQAQANNALLDAGFGDSQFRDMSASIQKRIAALSAKNNFNASTFSKYFADKTEQQIASILPILQNTSLDTLAGIEEAILSYFKSSGKTGDKLQAEPIIQLLRELENTITINFNTEYQTLTQSYTKNLKEFDKALKNATGGMGYEDAVNMANQLNITLKDFEQKDGKFYLKDIQKIKDKLMPGNSGLQKQLKTRSDVIYKSIMLQSGTLKQYYNKLSQISEQNLTDTQKQHKTLLQGFMNDNTYKEKGYANFKKYIERYRENVEALDEASDYIIRSTLLDWGDLGGFLKDLGSTRTNAQVYNQLLTNTLDPELEQYRAKLYEYFAKNSTAVYDSIIKLLNKESNLESIIVTENNQSLLQKLDIDKNVGEVVTLSLANLIGHEKQIAEELSSDLFLTQQQRLDEAAKLYNAQFKNNSYDTITSVIKSFEEFDVEEYWKLPISLQKFAEANDVTGKYALDINKAAEILNTTYLKNIGWDNKQINELQATIHKSQREKNIKTIAADIVKNRDSLDEENISAIATALDKTYDEVIALLHLQMNNDGTYRMNMNSILQLMEQKKGQLDTVLAQMIAEEIDNIIGNVSDIASGQNKGTTKFADMQKAVTRAQEAGFKVETVNDLYEWDEAVRGYVLKTQGLFIQLAQARMQLENLGQNQEEARTLLQHQIDSIGRELANNVDITKYISSPNNWNQNTEVFKNFKKSLEDLNKYFEATGKAVYSIDTVMSSLRQGGVGAVTIAQQIARLQGIDLSDDDITKIFRAKVDWILEANDQLTATAGEIISQDAGNFLNAMKSGAQLKKLENGSYLVIKSAENLAEAYLNIYYELVKSGHSTVEQLNGVAAQYFNAQAKTTKLDTLHDIAGAAELTYDELADLFTQAGWTMSTNIFNELKGVIENLDNGKARIVNFSAFAQALGIDQSTDEYFKALQEFNDNLIDSWNDTRNHVAEQIEDLSKAGPGDLVNVTQLQRTLGAKFTEIIGKYGGFVSDGILQITTDTKMPALIKAIVTESAEAGNLLKDEVKNLIDVVNQLYKDMADAIVDGMKGGLSNNDANYLKTQAKTNFGLDINFTQSYQGLKLSTNQAIKLYNALRQVDTVSAHLVFEELTEQLTKAGQACESMSRAMAEIARLEEQVAKSTGKARQEAEQQLSVYKEIASLQLNNPDAYDFMGNSLPDYLKGPENYWNSLGKAFKALNEAAKPPKEGAIGQGNYLDPTDFYNMVNEFNNIAKLSGTSIKFMGQELNGDMASAAKLIEQGMGYLTNIDGEGVKINLAKFGVNFTDGAEGMTKGVHQGIKAMALSQIEMLDGMIQLLETVVAMEGLKDVAGENNTIDLTDLFPEFTADTDKLTAYDDVKAWAKKLLDDTANKDLQKALNNIVINGESLRTTLTKLSKGYKFSEKEAKQVQNELNALYKMYLSGDYSLQNLIGSIKQVFAGSGFEGDVQVGDQTFHISQGYILEKGENGWKVPGVGQFKDEKAAIKAYQLKEETGSTKIIEDTKTGQLYTNITIAGNTIKVSTSADGIVYDVHGTQCKSYNQAAHELYEQYVKVELEDHGPNAPILTQDEWRVQNNVALKSSINITNEEEVKKNIASATHEQITALSQALASGDSQKIAEAVVPFKIDYKPVKGQTSALQSDINRIAELANIDTKTLALSLATEIVGDNAEGIKKILTNQPLTGTVQLTGEITGLTETQGNITYDKQVAVTLANIKAMATADNINWDGITTLINSVPEDKRPTVEAQAKQYIIKALEGNPEYQGFPALLTGLQGLPIPALQATATVMSILWGGDKATNATGLTTEKVNALAAALPNIPQAMLKVLATLVQITDGGIVPEESAELATKLTQLFQDNKYTPNDIKAITLVATAAAVMLNGQGVTATGEFDDEYKVADKVSQVTADIVKLIVSTNEATTTEKGTTFNADNWQGTVDKINAVAALLEVGLQADADINVDGANIPSVIATTQTINTLRTVADVLQVSLGTGAEINLATLNSTLADMVNNGEISPDSLENVKVIIASLFAETTSGEPEKPSNLENVVDPNLSVNRTVKVKINNIEYQITQQERAYRELRDILYKTKDEVGYKNSIFESQVLDNNNLNILKQYTNYLNQAREKTSQGTILSEADVSLLTRWKDILQDLQYRRKESFDNNNDLVTFLSGVNQALAQNEINISDETQQLGTLNTAFKDLDITVLQECATAMAELAENAKQVQSIPWDMIVSSINEINGIETPDAGLLDATTIVRTISANISLDYGGDEIAAEILPNDTITRDLILHAKIDNLQQLIQSLDNTLNIDATIGTTTTTTTATQTVGVDYDSSGLDAAEKGLQEVTAAAGSAAEQVENISGKLYDMPADTAQKIESYGTAAKETGTTAQQAGSSLRNAASRAASSISGLASSIRELQGTHDIDVNLRITATEEGKPGKVKGSVNGKELIMGTPTSISLKGASKAKGGQAYASGKTLVGELGPELVVSNGRYFLVGQTGAQMVSLPDDAIVFNHIQTQNLLKKQRGGGRGKPITNERNAVSFAKGTGPAMASASAALAALKQIRAMWQSMLGATMKDLGSLAGQEAGKAKSGGGGGGKDNEPEQIRAIVEEIERWYNLLRQINRLQQDITYQQSLQAEIESDRVANGRALYRSYKQEIEFLDQQIIRNQQLADLQKSWYERKRNELASSDYGKIFTYDENGQLQYRDGPNRGLDILQKLTQRDIYGQTSGAATNATTQIEYLKSIGFDTEKLKYNDDGTIIDASSDDYKDNPDQVYEDMMENFWNNLDGWKEQLDGIYDSYRDQLNNVLTNQTKRNQLLQKIIDNQLSVEQDVLKAIESRQQKLIDELQDQRDALEKSNKEFIDGLNDQLNQQKQMYQNAESEKELVKLRRQVAILQRSGGSASQIRSLQDQIAAKQQDQYFSAQQQQIAAIQKASDLQIQRLDSQIDLMTETLKYQKQNGLLWEEVYQIMNSTPQQIRQFITENTPDFQSASALDVAQKIRDIDLRINEWIGYRDDQSAPSMSGDRYYDWDSYSAARTEIYGNRASDQLKSQAKQEFDRILNETGDINAAGAAADAIFRAVLGDMPHMQQLEDDVTSEIANNIANKINQTINGYNTGSNGGYSSYSSGSNYNTWAGPTTKGYNLAGAYNVQASKSASNQQNEQQKIMNEMNDLKRNYIGASGPEKSSMVKAYQNSYNQLSETNKKKYSRHIYKSGGLVNYTGLAQVDGTPSRPEAFLNAEQTQLLRNRLFGSSDSLLALANDIVQQLHGASYSSNTLHKEENNGINIQNVDVNVNVKQIANDYDVRAIGNTVMDEMLKIARKSGTRGLSRR